MDGDLYSSLGPLGSQHERYRHLRDNAQRRGGPAGGGFFAFLLWQTGTGSLSSYELAARLHSADGVKPGADVKLAGVKIGESRRTASVGGR